MRASRGLKWENKMYKPKRSIISRLSYCARNRTSSLEHFYITITIIILGSFSFENSLMVVVVSRTSLSNS